MGIRLNPDRPPRKYLDGSPVPDFRNDATEARMARKPKPDGKKHKKPPKK